MSTEVLYAPDPGKDTLEFHMMNVDIQQLALLQEAENYYRKPGLEAAKVMAEQGAGVIEHMGLALESISTSRCSELSKIQLALVSTNRRRKSVVSGLNKIAGETLFDIQEFNDADEEIFAGYGEVDPQAFDLTDEWFMNELEEFGTELASYLNEFISHTEEKNNTKFKRIKTGTLKAAKEIGVVTCGVALGITLANKIKNG
jgi:hypothetical protein